MVAQEPTTFGVIVADAEGRVLFQSGCGTDAAVQRAVIEARRNSGKKPVRRLMAVAVGARRLVVLTRESPEAAVHFLHDGAEETLFDFIGAVDFAYAILNHFVSSPFEAMTVVDADANVRYISPVHEQFFGLGPGEGIGEQVTQVIQNTRLQEVVRSGRAEFGQIQEMRGVNRVVSRMPIRENGRVVGAIGQVMFGDPERLHDLSREIAALKSEVTFYRRELSGRKIRSYGLDQIVGKSAAIARLKTEILKIAPLDVPVLLIGESGTGKELSAHAIHALNPRHEHSMILVNAAALPPSLVESELFGYEPGTFTGAERKGRKGKFEQADKSTLFFDEIGDMPPEMQSKLLRVLQDGRFERVGGERTRYSDFRLIAATNCDLEEMIATNKFRLDLYYRISGVVLRMPPLRERLEDIPLLVPRFLAAFAERHGTPPKRVRPEVFDYLREQAWPGNVRQLQHEVERAAIFAAGEEIAVADFQSGKRAARTSAAVLPSYGTMHDAVGRTELSLIREAMARHQGNKKRVAVELGISRSYLYKRLREA